METRSSIFPFPLNYEVFDKTFYSLVTINLSLFPTDLFQNPLCGQSEDETHKLWVGSRGNVP